MADGIPISELPPGSPIQDTNLFPVVQSDSTNKVTGLNILEYVQSSYETGTFIPEFSTTGVDFDSITYAKQFGFYTRIGKMCTVNITLEVATLTIGSATGNLTVINLPFNGGTTNNSYQVGSVLCQFLSAGTSDTQLVPYLDSNSEFLRFNACNLNNDTGTTVVCSELNNNTSMNINITYITI